MATYRVLVAIKPRKTPSMYETSVLENLAEGYVFTSTTLQVLTPVPPITGQTGAITWVQLPNSYWVPLVYRGVEYVKDTSIVPPTGKRFTLDIEGFNLFTGTLIPKV